MLKVLVLCLASRALVSVVFGSCIDCEIDGSFCDKLTNQCVRKVDRCIGGEGGPLLCGRHGRGCHCLRSGDDEAICVCPDRN